MKARIVDSETGRPVNAEFILQDLAGHKADVTSKAVDGEFLVCLPSGSEYSLHIKDDGYVFESFNFSLKDTVQREAILLDVRINPMRPGQVVILHNVFFDTDSYELLDASNGELDELLALMRQYPGIVLEISGHTDNTGDREYNMILSEQRAKSVVEYLVSSGIDPSRLSAIGYGPDYPVADNNTKEGRAENRRTEFKILE